MRRLLTIAGFLLRQHSAKKEGDWVNVNHVKPPISVGVRVDIMYINGTVQLNVPSGVVKWPCVAFYRLR